jgi:hypothetical protein
VHGINELPKPAEVSARIVIDPSLQAAIPTAMLNVDSVLRISSQIEMNVHAFGTREMLSALNPLHIKSPTVIAALVGPFPTRRRQKERRQFVKARPSMPSESVEI